MNATAPKAASKLARGAIYLVASLTTSPGRLLSIIPTLASLGPSQQSRPFDEILLNLPDVHERTGQRYPDDAELPRAVQALATVNRCGRDYGPATKLVPTVRYLYERRLSEVARKLGLLPLEQNTRAVVMRTHIVTVDDDVLYPPGMAHSLERTAGPWRSEAASGFRLEPRDIFNPRGCSRLGGAAADVHGTRIDVVDGSAGWRIPLVAAKSADALSARLDALRRASADAAQSFELLLAELLGERRIPQLLHRTDKYHAGLVLRRVERAGEEKERWAARWRLLESSALRKLRNPERWEVLCPAPLRPLPREPSRADGNGTDAGQPGQPGTCRSLAGAQGYHLLGERHSGTNGLAAVVALNFGAAAPATQLVHKHMWASDGPRVLAEVSANLRALHAGGAPVILMVREPLQWLLAMHREPHHARWLISRPFLEFVKAEWRSWKVPGAAERCIRLGYVRNQTSGADWRAAADDAMHELSVPLQSVCAVHAFSNVIALRAAKLKLLRDAFELEPADETTRREQLVHTVSRRGAARGAGPVLVLRHEDTVTLRHRVPCMLARVLGLCVQRGAARFPLASISPQGTPDKGTVLSMWKASRLRTATTDPCKIAPMMTRGAFKLLLLRLDWGLEELFGYGNGSAYRACMTQARFPARDGMAAAWAQGGGRQETWGPPEAPGDQPLAPAVPKLNLPSLAPEQLQKGTGAVKEALSMAQSAVPELQPFLYQLSNLLGLGR